MTTQTHTNTTDGVESYSSWKTIWTTASREIQVLARSRAVLTTVSILLILVLGLIGFFTWQDRKDDDDAGTKVALVSAEGSAIAPESLEAAGLDGRESTDRSEAEQLVRDGEVEAAIVPKGEKWTVLFDGMPDPAVMSTVEQLAEIQAQGQAIESLGINPADYAAATPTIDVEPADVRNPDDPAADAEADFIRLLTAFVALSIIIFTVITFAATVGSRVTEEKSSRVVELILASVRPLDFLAGKILGNLILGFLATALILAVGSTALAFSGLLEGVDFAWGILPVMLVAWLLAMTFFGGLYAAAGAMVQRTEDIQQTQMPILILIMLSAYVPLMGWMSTDATWMQVVSWIPPLSIFAAPLTYAAGNFTALQLAGSFALAIIATIAVTWLAARIYRRTILNNGKTAKWSEALRG